VVNEAGITFYEGHITKNRKALEVKVDAAGKTVK